MTTIPRRLDLKQMLILRALASFDHCDPKRYWPLPVINERALKLSPNPRVTNSSRALAGLRRRGLVKGYYGHYRLTTAGVKMRASLAPQLPLLDSEARGLVLHSGPLGVAAAAHKRTGGLT
jgi:hypothetical protein